MKNINDYILESNVNKTMFDVCMEIENNDTIYKQYLDPLVKNCIKKLDSFDVNKLENSASIDKIIRIGLKETHASIDSNNRKTLRKYVTSIILKLISSNVDINKELEDYMIEWDYYNKLKW